MRLNLFNLKHDSSTITNFPDISKYTGKISQEVEFIVASSFVVSNVHVFKTVLQQNVCPFRPFVFLMKNVKVELKFNTIFY